jgi:hypothetical protein
MAERALSLPPYAHLQVSVQPQEQTNMMHSEAINEIAAALAKAQGQMEGAAKGKINPAFKSKYADLASVLEAAREPLSVNGLAVVQLTQKTPDGLVLITKLVHSSGQWFSGEYPINPVKNDPQGFGSSTTYARRYALMAMVGIAPEDDDGEAAMGRGHQQAANCQPAAQQSPQRDSNGIDIKALRASQERLTKDIKKAIAASVTQEELQKGFTEAWPTIKALPDDLKAEVTAAKDAQKALLMDEAA